MKKWLERFSPYHFHQFNKQNLSIPNFLIFRLILGFFKGAGGQELTIFNLFVFSFVSTLTFFKVWGASMAPVKEYNSFVYMDLKRKIAFSHHYVLNFFWSSMHWLFNHSFGWGFETIFRKIADSSHTTNRIFQTPLQIGLN